MRRNSTGETHAPSQTRLAHEGGKLRRCLISPGTNLYYLTGLTVHEAGGERPTILAVNADGDYGLLAPSLYENVIGGDFPVTFWRDGGENPYEKLAWILAELHLSGGRILVEDTMRADWLINVMKLGPSSSIL